MDTLQKSPLCPNCGRAMRLVRTLPGRPAEEVHVFGCDACRVNYTTEDHYPIFPPLG